MNTDSFLAELKRWQLETFPDETLPAVYQHLQEEVGELGEDTADPLELADCLMLLCCLCFRQGVDPIAAMRAKHEINIRRRWEKTARGFRHAP